MPCWKSDLIVTWAWNRSASFRLTRWLKIMPHMIRSYYRCCCINEPVILSHCVHLKPGHWFHALLKVCCDRDDIVPLRTEQNNLIGLHSFRFLYIYLDLIKYEWNYTNGVHFNIAYLWHVLPKSDTFGQESKIELVIDNESRDLQLYNDSFRILIGLAKAGLCNF